MRVRIRVGVLLAHQAALNSAAARQIAPAPRRLRPHHYFRVASRSRRLSVGTIRRTRGHGLATAATLPTPAPLRGAILSFPTVRHLYAS